jgi:hypothetical protein
VTLSRELQRLCQLSRTAERNVTCAVLMEHLTAHASCGHSLLASKTRVGSWENNVAGGPLYDGLGG